MSSSTLPSKPTGTLAPPPANATCPGRSVERQCLAIFALTFLVALASARLLLRNRSVAAVFEGRAMASNAVVPTNDDDYLGYFRGTWEDYAVYDNFDHCADPLKKADVLIMGNSRVMFAFRNRALLDRYFADRKLTYFVLAFGYGEQSSFAQTILRKYDVHPKWVIVNPDPYFGGKPSFFAKKVMADSQFNAFKFHLETVSAFESQRYLHRVVPYFGTPFWINPDGDSIWFRSKRNGTMFLACADGEPSPAITPKINAYGQLWEPDRVPAAREFQREMTQCGAKLVLTCIPPDSNVSAVGFAKELNVPLIAPNLPGLWTLDGSHLDDQSSTRFTTAFLSEFGKLLDHQGPDGS